MWDGSERRSAGSVAARAVIAAQREAEKIEALLAEERSKRFPGKKRLQQLEGDLRDIRAVERRCLGALGGAQGEAPSAPSFPA